MTTLILLTDLYLGSAQHRSHISASLVRGWSPRKFTHFTHSCGWPLRPKRSCGLPTTGQLGSQGACPLYALSLEVTWWVLLEADTKVHPTQSKGAHAQCSVEETLCMKNMGFKRHISVATFRKYNLLLCCYELPR